MLKKTSNKRPRVIDTLLGHLPDRNKLDLCSSHLPSSHFLMQVILILTFEGQTEVTQGMK